MVEAAEAELWTTLDLGTLALYCQIWARWKEAEKLVAELGSVVKSPQGTPVKNPYLSVADTAIKQLAVLGRELGLTPSSRVRRAR
jgi:P27 family predicted phage terminase small subunit